MYLVNDEGVIKCIKKVAAHVIDDSHDDVRSALRVMREECDQLCTSLEAKEEVIDTLEVELADARTTIEQLKTMPPSELTQEVEGLKADLTKETQSPKDFGS